MENYILGQQPRQQIGNDNGAPFSYYVVTTSDDDKTKPDEEKTMKKVVESKTGKFYLKKRCSSWKITLLFLIQQEL